MDDRMTGSPRRESLSKLVSRSGYGLCGFFLAGNEHVLIGTKDPATPKPRAENDVERVQSVGCVYGCAN